MIDYLSVTGALFGPADLFVSGGTGEVNSVTSRPDGTNPPIETTSVLTFTISGPETVTVPAGTFKALKVESVNNSTSTNGQTGVFQLTSWFVYGIGQVKTITSFGAQSELVRFTVP